MLANNSSVKFAKRDVKRKALTTAVNLDTQCEVDEEQIEWLLQCVEGVRLFLRRLSCECTMCGCRTRISFYLPLYLLINIL